MKYIQDQLEKWANRKGLLISIAAFIGIAWIANGSIIGVAALKEVSNGVGVLGTEQGYSLEVAYTMLDTMGKVGRQFYLTHIIPMDFLFSTAYGITFGLMILMLFKKLMPNNVNAHGIAMIPVVATFLDYFKNICLVMMFVNYPNKLVTLFEVSNLLSIIKSSLVGFSVLIILLCLMIVLIKNGAKKVGIGK